MLKVLNGAWWVILYQFLITFGYTLVFMSGSVQHYRFAVNIHIFTLEPSIFPNMHDEIDAHIFGHQHSIVNHSD